LQLKLRKRFGETTIKKIWDGNKIEKKGDLNSIEESDVEKIYKND